MAEHLRQYQELMNVKAALDLEISRQAEMIAYNNSFRLVMLWTAVIAPLVYFVVRPVTGAGGARAK